MCALRVRAHPHTLTHTIMLTVMFCICFIITHHSCFSTLTMTILQLHTKKYMYIHRSLRRCNLYCVRAASCFIPGQQRTN